MLVGGVAPLEEDVIVFVASWSERRAARALASRADSGGGDRTSCLTLPAAEAEADSADAVAAIPSSASILRVMRVETRGGPETSVGATMDADSPDGGMSERVGF